MNAPSHDQLSRLGTIADEASQGYYGTTLEVHAEPVTYMRVRVVARDENEINSSGEIVTHTILLDELGREVQPRERIPEGI